MRILWIGLLISCLGTSCSSALYGTAGTPGVRRPPPTEVQFFPCPKPVHAYRGVKNGGYQAYIQFTVRDGVGNEDTYGDDDQTLVSDINRSASHAAAVYTVLTPSHRRREDKPDSAADVDVNRDYRTTELSFMVRVGDIDLDEPIVLSVPDPSTDDLRGRITVRFETADGRTTVTVGAVYWDGEAERPLSDSATVNHNN